MKRRLTFAFALVFACATAVWAQGDDVGTWTSVQVMKSIERNYLMARVEHRSYDKLGATECYFGMAGAGRRFTNWLSGDLSYELWKVPASGNVTVHKGVASVTGSLKQDAMTLALREKYELSFNEDGSTGHTLRSRLRAQYKVDGTVLTPYVMYEFFNGFAGTGWIRSLHYAGTEIRLGKGSVVDVFYMYHLHPDGGGTTGCHTVGVGYVLNL